MSDIAAVVGINRPTLHYYFRTKDKMFQAVFASIVAKFLPHIDTIFSTQQSFSEKLEDVIDVYVSIFSTNPLLPKFIIGEIQRDANHLIETFYSLNLDQYLKHIGEFLEKEMESGNFKKVPLPFIFMTLYSQLAFPFLSKNLTMKLFSMKTKIHSMPFYKNGNNTLSRKSPIFETVKDKTKGGVVMNDAPSLYIKKKGRHNAPLLSYNTKPSYSADVANGAGVV